MSMVGAFLKSQDIDLALLQEVTNTDFTTFTDYIAIVNEGTEKTGTAILTKVGLQLQHVKRIPSGRSVPAMFKGIWIINIYAPSGGEKRSERECFYKTDVIYLLPRPKME